MASSGASNRKRWLAALGVGAALCALFGLSGSWRESSTAAVTPLAELPVTPPVPAPQGSPPPLKPPTAEEAVPPSMKVTATAPPTLAERRLPGGTRFFGSVVTANGNAPVRAGASCELGAVPVVGVAGECRAFLECDGTVLYGQPDRHPVRCTQSPEGDVTSVSDGQTSARDYDALLRGSTASGQLEVRDERPGEYGEYGLIIELSSVEAARH